MEQTYRRGELYFADLGEGVGSEQSGVRPVVILQNDVGNRYGPTVIVAPLSSKRRCDLPTHCYIGRDGGLSRPSIVLLEQLRTIDKSRLRHRIGKLSAFRVSKIDRALAISIDLVEKDKKYL